MIDLLAAWGVSSAAGLIFKPVIEDLYLELKTLTKDATEDWVKDFFKDRLSAGSKSGYGRLLGRFHREPLDIAAGKAIKGFLKIFQDCLDDAELDNNAIASYTQSIKLFLKDKSIRQVLGRPFQDNNSYHDSPEIFELLANCAVKDLFMRGESRYARRKTNPRKTALQGIVEYFSKHPQTKELLIDRENNDPDEQVKEFAQQALEKLSE